MKTNQVAMPHMIERTFDICICQSVIDAHPGNYWLYYRLPKTKPDRVEAVRIIAYPCLIPPGPGPRLFAWDGSLTCPTLTDPLTDDDGHLWLLKNGELHRVERLKS